MSKLDPVKGAQNGWMDAEMDGCLNGWMGEWVGGGGWGAVVMGGGARKIEYNKSKHKHIKNENIMKLSWIEPS